MSFSFVTSAPGKVILSGEHAVVHGCHAVATVVDRRTYTSFTAKSEDELVSFFIKYKADTLRRCWTVSSLTAFRTLIMQKAADALQVTIPSDSDVNVFMSEYIEQNADALSVIVDLVCDHFDQLETAIHERITSDDSSPIPEALLKTLDIIPSRVFVTYYLFFVNYSQPITVSVDSELPMGSGLGSSASLCAALATGFFVLGQFAGSIPETYTISDEDRAVINRWSFQGERIIHGNPSGVDNTCVVYGGVIVYRRINGQPSTRFLPSGCIPASVQLIVSDTCIPKDTKALVAKVGRNKSNFPTVMEPLLQAFDALALRLVEATESYVAADKTTPDTARVAAEEWFDIASALFPMNQGMLDAVGVGHAVISQIVHEAAKVGLVTKLTGAGGGGSVITLVPPSESVEATETRVALFEEMVSKMGGKCIQTVMGQGGVRVEQM